ncbi:TPA: hypothetical protein QB662_002095 [Pasteurella multocida]|nr:hypothetical protein [Pasteurella multocida]
MEITRFKILLIALIILGNGYVFLGGPAKKQFAIEAETRRIYRTLAKEIIFMNGEYKQFGGRVIQGFTLVISFSHSSTENRIKILEKIKEMGFDSKNKTSKLSLHLFCQGESGFLIAEKPEFRIDYEKKMTYCLE